METFRDHCRVLRQIHIVIRIYDSSVRSHKAHIQSAFDLSKKAGIDPRRNIFYHTDFERGTYRLIDGVVPISIESIANVFGADLLEGDAKPFSEDQSTCRRSWNPANLHSSRLGSLMFPTCSFLA